MNVDVWILSLLTLAASIAVGELYVRYNRTQKGWQMFLVAVWLEYELAKARAAELQRQRDSTRQ